MANLRWDGDDFRNPQASSGSTAGKISHSGKLQQGYQHGSLTQGLVAYYPMDAGSGSTLEDKTELDNTGTINGASWKSDSRIGENCLDFDGQDDYVDITNSSLKFSNSRSISVSAWVKIQDNENEYRHFVSFGGSSDNTPRVSLSKARSGWSDGRIYFQIVNSSNRIDIFSNDDGSQLPKDHWLHLTAVVNRLKAESSLYINANQNDKGGVVDYSFSNISDFSARIGQSAWGNASHNSVIDDVRIYNRALSTPEIRTLYNLTSPSNVSPADTLQ
jgi:hypothetical protein